MFKVAIATVFCVFTVGFFYAPVEAAVDWPAVKDKINELKGIYAETMTTVGEIAKKNEAESLAKKIAELGQSLFSELDKGVEEQTLTVDEAKAQFEQVKEKCKDLKAEIFEEVGKKSPEDAKKIGEAFESARTKCFPKRKELEELLKA